MLSETGTKLYVMMGGLAVRVRRYREHRDCVAGMHWHPHETTPWLCADELDPRYPDPRFNLIAPQPYNFDAVAYESIMLGKFSI